MGSTSRVGYFAVLRARSRLEDFLECVRRLPQSCYYIGGGVESHIVLRVSLSEIGPGAGFVDSQPDLVICLLSEWNGEGRSVSWW